VEHSDGYVVSADINHSHIRSRIGRCVGCPFALAWMASALIYVAGRDFAFEFAFWATAASGDTRKPRTARREFPA